MHDPNAPVVPTGLPPFRFESPETLAEALSLVGAGGTPLAGGTDLLGMMKDGVVSPRLVVGLGRVSEIKKIEFGDSAVRIGAGVSVRDLAESPLIGQRIPCLADAASRIGTPQIRNMATFGGNLCQKPRCWFYRSRFFLCAKKGGDTCFAQEFDTLIPRSFRPACVAAHPSDFAPVLLVLGADLVIASETASRQLTAERFFRTHILADETALRPGEILVAAEIPNLDEGEHSAFQRAEERDSWGFASVSVSVVLRMDGDYVDYARIAFGSLARLPFRATEAETMLRGRRLDSTTLAEVGSAAVRSVPLTQEQVHKSDIAIALLGRALHQAAKG